MLIELSSWLVPLLPKLGPKGKFSHIPCSKTKDLSWESFVSSGLIQFILLPEEKQGLMIGYASAVSQHRA